MPEVPAPFATSVSEWMRSGGPSDDVVVSTRVRLARNLVEYPFTPVASPEAGKEVRDAVAQATCEIGRVSSEGYAVYFLDEMDAVDQWILVEKHLASPHLLDQRACAAVVLDDAETVSIMVNEEDHLRIQCLFPGFDMDAAWERADSVDDHLSRVLDYAFDGRYGYLTACPSNLGTGLRGSVMLHLPGLVLSGQMEQIMSGLHKVGAVVRGVYGEGSAAEGNLFQVSNRVSLGVTEADILYNLSAVATELINRERSAREALFNADQYALEDRVYRSYGILANARKMSSEEALGLLSMVRLGSDLGILTPKVRATFAELMVRMRRASLQRILEETLDAEHRDIRRASMIRERIQQAS